MAVPFLSMLSKNTDAYADLAHEWKQLPPFKEQLH